MFKLKYIIRGELIETFVDRMELQLCNWYCKMKKSKTAHLIILSDDKL